MAFLERLTRFLNQLLIWIAGLFLGIMIFLTCGNIFCRILWVPIPGTFELMGYFGAIATAFALGYTQLGNGHIAVDVLVLRFSGRTRKILHSINCFICMIFFAIVTWRISLYATTLLRTGEVTETLRIVYYPFTYGVALGCATLALVFLTELLKAILPEGMNK